MILVIDGVCYGSSRQGRKQRCCRLLANDLPYKFVVNVEERQESFLRCISYLSFTYKDCIKLGSLQTLALAQQQDFQNY